MNKFTAAMKRFGGFMKRNAFYFLIILCIASVAAVIALSVTRDNGGDIPTINAPIDDNNKPGDTDKPDDPVKPNKKAFVMPTNNGETLVSYSEVDMVWNQSLNQSETHLGIDYLSEDLNVFAVADGKITAAGFDELKGHYVVIEHENGYKSSYYSLDKSDTLVVGSNVTQGQLLGQMSDSFVTDVTEGAHLHFEMTLNNVAIDPLEVLISEDK